MLFSFLGKAEGGKKTLGGGGIPGCPPSVCITGVKQTCERRRICNEEALHLSFSSGPYPEYLGIDIEGPQDRNYPQTCNAFYFYFFYFPSPSVI